MTTGASALFSVEAVQDDIELRSRLLAYGKDATYMARRVIVDYILHINVAS